MAAAPKPCTNLFASLSPLGSGDKTALIGSSVMPASSTCSPFSCTTACSGLPGADTPFRTFVSERLGRARKTSVGSSSAGPSCNCGVSTLSIRSSLGAWCSRSSSGGQEAKLARDEDASIGDIEWGMTTASAGVGIVNCHTIVASTVRFMQNIGMGLGNYGYITRNNSAVGIQQEKQKFLWIIGCVKLVEAVE